MRQSFALPVFPFWFIKSLTLLSEKKIVIQFRQDKKNRKER